MKILFGMGLLLINL